VPVTQRDLDWLAARLLPDLYDINQRDKYDRNTRRLTALHNELKDCMSVQNIKGLAEIVRQTRASLAAASLAAGDMQTSAASVTNKINQINDLTNELKAADAELGAAIGQLSNGGPSGPLPDTPTSATPIQASSQQPQAQAAHPIIDMETRRDRPRV
jgi:hypothetical protein